MTANETHGAAAARTELDAPVDEVMVMEDRARVVRRGSARVAAGRTLCRVAGVSPLLADKTLAVRAVSGPPGASVAGARVIRRLKALVTSLSENLAGLEQELAGLTAGQTRLEAGRAALEAETESLADAYAKTLRDISVDASFGKSDPKDWERMLGLLSEREAGARRAGAELGFELEKLGEKRADLELRIQAARNPGSAMDAEIEIDFASPQEGECPIEISYTAPCVCWRPAHSVTVSSDEGKTRAVARTDAFLWQFTGEDWKDALVSFSTQRPSLGAKPPVLYEDSVRAQDKRDKVEVEARDQAVQTAGLGGGGPRKADEMPGIDDGGEVFALQAPGRITAVSDGMPRRIPLQSFETEAAMSLVCMPEMSNAAVRRLEMSNSSPRPLLAGPVDLVGRSGYVGRTSILFVAPGEKFELGFGPDPELRIRRNVERVDKEKSAFSKWIRSLITVTLRVSNTGPSSRRFKLTERIPVSEIEQVRIDFDEKACKPEVRPDADGFLNYDVEVPGFGAKTLTYAYALDKTSEVTGI